MTEQAPVRFAISTPTGPGAIGIVDVVGDADGLANVHQELSSDDATLPHVGGMRLESWVDSAGTIDRGLVVRTGASHVQLMPHGGPRILQRLAAALQQYGAIQTARVDYVEGQNELESSMLAQLANAPSPRAIDLLLAQPERHLRASRPTTTDMDRAERLRHLLEPPRVVLAGPANVGKSTLSNALLGRSMSITVDAPGTTRDYVAGRIELDGLVVIWHDTPGIRASDDSIEQEALRQSAMLMEEADLLLAVTDAAHDWAPLPRAPDLRIGSRADCGVREDTDMNICALDGTGLEELAVRVRRLLVSDEDLEHDGPWFFDMA